MEMVDSEQHHFSAPAHDSGSVPPGLSHDDSSHESSGPAHGVANGGTDPDAPSVIPEENAPTAPPSSEAEAFSPAHSAVAELGIPNVEPVTQSAADADAGSSEQTNEQTSIPALHISPSIPTIPDTNAQAMEPLATQAVEENQTHSNDDGLPMEPTQLLDGPHDTQDSERPPSPDASLATMNASLLPPAGPSEEPSQHIKFDSDSSHIPSANRLSISYAAGTRRMVIDSGVVEKLKVFRSDARIEVHMSISEDHGHLKGILVRASDLCCTYTILTNCLGRRNIGGFYFIYCCRDSTDSQ